MADDQTTGTPGTMQDGADAAAAASGTPAGTTDGGDAATVDADEIKKLREIREKYLANLETIEKKTQEAEHWRQQAEQASRASLPPTGYDPAAQRAARLAQSLQNLQDRDPEAVEVITETARMTQEALARQEAQARYYRELYALPAADQAEVERIAKAENLWPSLAHDRLLARRYRESETSIAEQRRKLQEQEDKLKRGVVKTTAAPDTSVSTGTEPTQEEYARTMRLAAEGNPDARKKVGEWDRREEAEGPLKFRSG